jgi:adenylylsulfate kinase
VLSAELPMPKPQCLKVYIMNIDSRRKIKEMIASQRTISIWLVGLSGSGKSTLAYELDTALAAQGYLSVILDGDDVRKGLNSNLGFSEPDRVENIRRIAEVSKLFVNNGVITLNAFICPTEKMRALAKNIIGDEDFLLIYLDSPVEVCEKRDVKGLYKKARKGEIKEFTGISADFEKPKKADLVLDTANNDVDDCVVKLMDFVLPKISGKMI